MKIKNQNHEKFCQEYVEATKRNYPYYVYGLAYPDSGEIYYIGKGKDERVIQHLSLDGKNEIKDNCILASIRRGGYHYIILCYCKDERTAYKVEREFIQQNLRNGISNLRGGTYSQEERDIISAKIALARIKPFNVWIKERERSEEEKKLYWEIYKEYELIASGYWHKIYRECRARIK